MLMPKKIKHRKQQKGRMRGKAQKGNTIAFGSFALKTTEASWITSRQIEAARRAMTRHIKRGGRIWIRIFPDVPVSKKPAEVRMGSGKGNPELWVAVILPGKMLFEIGGVSDSVARECLRLADTKLGIRTQLVTRHVTGA